MSSFGFDVPSLGGGDFNLDALSNGPFAVNGYASPVLVNSPQVGRESGTQQASDPGALGAIGSALFNTLPALLKGGTDYLSASLQQQTKAQQDKIERAQYDALVNQSKLGIVAALSSPWGIGLMILAGVIGAFALLKLLR